MQCKGTIERYDAKVVVVDLLSSLSEGGYGINTQVEKSKKMTTVNFMGYVRFK